MSLKDMHAMTFNHFLLVLIAVTSVTAYESSLHHKMDKRNIKTLSKEEIDAIYRNLTRSKPAISRRRAESDFMLEIPDHCQEQDFCEDVPNYPQEQINNLIAQNPDLATPPEITRRRGPGEDNIELCDLDAKTIAPSAAKNIYGQWVLVMNKKDEPFQTFYVEQCRNTNGPCKSIIELGLRPGTQTICEQRHEHQAVWSVDQATGQPKPETISVPTFCVCAIKKPKE